MAMCSAVPLSMYVTVRKDGVLLLRCVISMMCLSVCRYMLTLYSFVYTVHALRVCVVVVIIHTIVVIASHSCFELIFIKVKGLLPSTKAKHKMKSTFFLDVIVR